MTNELGNTTLESLGILTGIEGYRAALADPPNWQARLDGESQWLDYEDALDNCWSVWDARMIVHDSVVQWRRKPDMKRDPMRYVVRPIELRDDMIVGEPNGHFVDVNLRLPFAWNRKVATITVDERVDAQPAQQPVEPPGSIITWQRAQERVDAGLAVETPVYLNEKRNEWAAIGSDTIGSGTPAEYPHWTYRIPLQPAEAIKEVEAVAMTECAAMEYLKSGPDYQRAVIDRDGDVWTYGNGKVVLHESEAGSVIMLGSPFTPLLPATRSQVEMERELSTANETIASMNRDLDKLSAWAQTRNAQTGRHCADVALDRISTLEQQLASAIGSQKAAVAALEVERMHGCWLRNALELCARYFGSASVDDLRQHIAKTLRDIDETAGKESG